MTARTRQITDQTVGTLRRHRPDSLLVMCMIILMLVGLVVIYSISPALTARINAVTAESSLDQNHFMYRQIIYLALGIGAFVVASWLPLSLWTKYQNRLFVGALGLCLVPILFAATNLALCAGGACRWINLGFVSLQPAEIAKFALLVFLAGFLAKRIQEGKLNDLHETLIPAGVALAALALIVVGLQRDLGTGLAVFGITASMLFVGGLRLKYVVLVLGAISVVGLFFVLSSSYRLERVTTFLQGNNDNKDTSGYHINQALIAVGSGGLAGVGLGQSIQAFGYLPEAANDSIFAIVAEKFGFIGMLLILSLFGVLLLRLIKIMDMAGNEYHRLLVAGTFGWVFTHTVVNIGAMLGIFPLTGVTLPFLSFGGTSLLFMMLALGVVFQISRYTTHGRNTMMQEGGMRDEDRRSRRGLGRPRYAGISRY